MEARIIQFPNKKIRLQKEAEKLQQEVDNYLMNEIDLPLKLIVALDDTLTELENL